jgi:hypothetical protein
VVSVVGELGPLDRLQGLVHVYRLDRIGILGWLDRVVLLGILDRFGRLLALGPVGTFTMVGDVVQVPQGDAGSFQLPAGLTRHRTAQGDST